MQLPDQVRAAGRNPAVLERLPAPYAVLPQEPPPQDLLETLRTLVRHRKIIIGATAGAAFLGAVFAITIPTKFTAEAQVEVGVPVVKLFNVDALSTGAPQPGGGDSVQTEATVLQSRVLAREVVDRLHLDENPEYNPTLPPVGTVARVRAAIGNGISALFSIFKSRRPVTPAELAKEAARNRDRMADILLGSLDVGAIGRSDVLSIKAKSRDPEVAAQVANAMADAYLDQKRNNKIATANQIEHYMDGRIGQLRQQVEISEQAVEDYRRQHGLYATSATSGGIAAQELTELNTQLILAQTAKAEADSRLHEAILARRQGLSGDSVPAVLNSPLISALKQQQAIAEQQLAELTANYGPQHPKVINTRAQIGDIQRKLALEISGVISGLEHESRSADARYATLMRNFEQTKTQMGGVNEKAIRLEALQRDAAVNRNLLDSMLGEQKELIGHEALDQPNARLTSPATPPDGPSTISRSFVVFLAGIGGCLIGILAAFTREGTDRTFRVGEQIETATGLPVISLVPTQKGVPPMEQVLRNPVSPYSEALRKITIGLELSAVERSPKTVLLCSSTPAEGKSVMAASLGRLLASNGKRILLIDCDWRNPNLHRLVKVSNKCGLSELLTDETVILNDCLHHDPLSGLDILPAGRWDGKALPMLTSERMRLILQTFATRYDLIILDTAPVLVGAEVLALARMVDKVVFTIRWGSTRREVALDALRQLVDARGDVAGVVLSRVDPKGYRQYAYAPLNYEYVRPVAG